MLEFFKGLSDIGIIAVAGYLIIKEILIFANKKKNGNNKENNQQNIDIALIKQELEFIKNNHLKHIEDWMEKHEKEHNFDKQILIIIATKLGVKEIPRE